MIDLAYSTPHHLIEDTRPPRPLLPADILPQTLITILLADDDEDDIFLMKMACAATGIPHRLQVVVDGEMAVDYIFGKGCYADRMVYPIPDIIFLDIKMPKLDGFEVLKLIRARPGIKQIPVILFSNSTLMADVDRAYQLGVTSFVRKVPSALEFGRAIQLILKGWLQLKNMHH